ncbi:hypothetical protein RQP46_002875 [Phenoliferia psychrophenolica]
MSSPPGPESILSLAHGLHSRLISSFAPPLPANSAAPTTHLLHPLSSISPAKVPAAQESLRATFAAMRSSCAAFSSQLLDPTSQLSSSHPSSAIRPATEKLISLLKETAASQAVLLSHRQDATRAADAIKSRRLPIPILSYDLLEGFTGGGPAERTLAIIESVSNALGLDSFKETAGDVHTFSLGGKVMALDVDVEASSGRVLRTKFSYALESQREDEDVAKVLTAALDGIERVLEVEHEAAVEQGLARFRSTLAELKVLDEMTEETTTDCFAVLGKMARSVQSVLLAESADATSLAPDAHGLPTIDSRNPHSAILFHASAAAQLTPEWAHAVESRDFSLLHESRPNELSTVRISLEKPTASVVPPAEYLDITASPDVPASVPPLSPSFTLHHTKTAQWPTFLPTDATTCPTFVARFDPAVPITAATGRRIMDVMRGQVSDDVGAGMAREVMVGAGVAGRPPGWADTTWLEDLLISKKAPTVTRFSPGDSYQVKFDDVRLEQHYTLADPGTQAGFLCSDVRFQSPAQLFRVIEIVKEQLLLNDLAKSVFNERHRVAQPPSPTKATKRRKITPLSLTDLFDGPFRFRLPS